MALGATPAAVRRLVLRQSMVPAAVGCAAGGLLAIWLARGLSAMVLGIDARDPRVFGAAMAALLAAALAASWWPALRATRVDPMTTLRD
jgi:ABC-type lipoprotein release transport system permease subunit